MPITRWDHARHFVTLREAMDRLFEDSFIRPGQSFDGRGASFPVDLGETADAFILKANLPGVKPDEVEVNATSDVLSIRAETKPAVDLQPENWLLQERRFGTLQRTFTLPTPIDPNKVEASFEQGVLTLSLPKAEAARPKHIKVNTNAPIEGRAR